MRAAPLSSNSQESESPPQDGCTQSSYCGASAGQSEQALTAEIADVIKRGTVSGPHPSHKSAQWALADLDFDGYLPRPIRPDTLAWLKNAKRKRRRARAGRALCWVLVLVIGVSAHIVSRTPDSLNALQSLKIEVARVLDTVSL